MPNTTSAKKALRQSFTRRSRNIQKKRLLRDVLKRFDRAVTAKDKTQAATLMIEVQKTLDKSAKAGIIKKNTASRKKSRLAGRLKKIA